MPAGGSDAAVAVLEFFARAAGAGRIARRAGPGRPRRAEPLPSPLARLPVAAIAIGMAIAAPRPRSAGRHRRGRARLRKFHLLLGRDRLAEDHLAVAGGRRGRWLHAQLDMAQHRGYLLPQIDQHLLEEVKRLALVFVEGVALRVGPQVDALAEMVERQEVVLPGLVEQLQQQALLGHAH